MEVRGFEPRTFRMQSGRSTTELHPQLTPLHGKKEILIFLRHLRRLKCSAWSEIHYGPVFCSKAFIKSFLSWCPLATLPNERCKGGGGGGVSPGSHMRYAMGKITFLAFLAMPLSNSKRNLSRDGKCFQTRISLLWQTLTKTLIKLV